MERIAAVDGSAGWCAAIGAGSNVFAGYMPATGARTVFADPDQGNATMFAPLGRVVSRSRPGRAERPLAVHEQLPAQRLGRPRGAVPQCRWNRSRPARGVRARDRPRDRGHLGRRRPSRDRQPPRRRCGGSVDLEQCTHFADRPWPDGTLWRLPIYTALLPILVAVPARHRPRRHRRGCAAGARGPDRAARPTGRRSGLDGGARRRRHPSAGGPGRTARRGRRGACARRARRAGRPATPGPHLPGCSCTPATRAWR